MHYLKSLSLQKEGRSFLHKLLVEIDGDKPPHPMDWERKWAQNIHPDERELADQFDLEETGDKPSPFHLRQLRTKIRTIQKHVRPNVRRPYKFIVRTLRDASSDLAWLATEFRQNEHDGLADVCEAIVGDLHRWNGVLPVAEDVAGDILQRIELIHSILNAYE